MTERPSRHEVPAGAGAAPDALRPGRGEAGLHGAPAASRVDPRSSPITPDELAAWTGGRLLARGRREILGGSVDSRTLRPGEVFFALPGEHTDGHRFLEAAVAAGAGALVVTEPLPESRAEALRSSTNGAVPATIVRVGDAGDALRSTAAAWRERFDPLVVGITGSLAKTSTKEQVAEVLATRFVVLRSEGNLNNEIGLPLTLLRLRHAHEAAVLEMGLYTSGEIALLARLARPAIGVVTAVRGVHLSRAGSIEAIESGKRELVEALPAEGWAILNADDDRVVRMRAHTPARALTYGFAPTADVRGEDVRSLGVDGMRLRLRVPEGAREVRIPALGRHGVHNALAAAAVGVAAGLSLVQIGRGIARPAPAPHRSQLHQSGGLTILDDTYNASPDAMVAALELLASLPGRRVAVLGEMLELGETSEHEHRRVGRRAASIADLLVVVGQGAAGIEAGALEAGLDRAACLRAADRDEAGALLGSALRPGDVVLVKASRGGRLDELIDGLLALGRDMAGP